MNGWAFEQFQAGQRWKAGPRRVKIGDIEAFGRLTGDLNPLHFDEEFARRGLFGRRIAHGMLSASFTIGLASSTGIYEGTILALLEHRSRFMAPVFPGDDVTLDFQVTETRPSSRPDRGVVRFAGELATGSGRALVAEWAALMRIGGTPDAAAGGPRRA